MRLDQVDVSGAVFVFSSRLLYDEDFRAIFPQQCLVCGSREDLVVQRVIWGERFVPRVAPLPVPLKHLGDLRGRSLLAKLSPLHDVAEPYGLAMPFYLCGPCRVEAALEARADPAGQCWLKIFSLAHAQAFLAAARNGLRGPAPPPPDAEFSPTPL